MPHRLVEMGQCRGSNVHMNIMRAGSGTLNHRRKNLNILLVIGIGCDRWWRGLMIAKAAFLGSALLFNRRTGQCIEIKVLMETRCIVE